MIHIPNEKQKLSPSHRIHFLFYLHRSGHGHGQRPWILPATNSFRWNSWFSVCMRRHVCVYFITQCERYLTVISNQIYQMYFASYNLYGNFVLIEKSGLCAMPASIWYEFVHCTSMCVYLSKNSICPIKIALMNVKSW